jgi:hypothetical protein
MCMGYLALLSNCFGPIEQRIDFHRIATLSFNKKAPYASGNNAIASSYFLDVSS